MLRRDRAPTSLPFSTTGTFLMRLAANRAHTSSTGVVAYTEITRRVATAMTLRPMSSRRRVAASSSSM